MIAPTGDVPEQKSLTLVIMSPEYAQPTGSTSASLERAIKQIATKKGNSDRIYRNTIFYLACSEAGRAALNGQLCDLLACNKILEEYAGRLESDQKQDIQTRKKEFDRQVDAALIKAYNIVAKCSAKEGIEYYELKAYAMDFSTQVRQTLMSELVEEEWILHSIGRTQLSRNNLLPEIGRPISVETLFETFLRFDDKPMILGKEAIINTVNTQCQRGLFNVGVGIEGQYTKIYHDEEVPFFGEQNWDELWLLDPSVLPPSVLPSSVLSSSGSAGNAGPSIQSQEDEELSSSSNTEEENVVKTYRKVTTSGGVPMENWIQLFPSFINTLRKNNLKIDVK
ncbi:MAG TPA: hypothetical protein DHU72_03855, partial [Rikenellaceae bacterium]|nr:hypothetical protein [Rikenellaceae bacterium]